MECILWLHWFYKTERSVGHMSPLGGAGLSCAMQVRVGWMHGAANTAEFSVDFSDYYGCGIYNSEQTCEAIDTEKARVTIKFEDHNTEPKKRPWEDVYEKLLTNMQQCFKGGEARYAHDKGRRADAHRERMQCAAYLCVTERLAERGMRSTASKVMGLTDHMLSR